MQYTITEAASRFSLSAHTLRYYDKEGLLPFVGRDPSGNRVFTESDLDWVAMVCCLKETGMSIKEIKQYADWCAEGMQTIDQRKEMLVRHRRQVVRKMAELKKNLALIDSKIAVYENPELAEKRYGGFKTRRRNADGSEMLYGRDGEGGQ